ncbi:Ig-like domain-containing protein, partial [Patescibacteria group bacterium]
MKKQLLISISLAVVVIAGGVVLYFYLDNNRTVEPVVNQEPIPVTVVSDNQFTLQADTVDSLGVNSDSTFTLTSKSAVTEDMIASSLQIEPAFAYKIESSDSNTFTLIPKENLTSNTVYAFSLAAEQSDTEQLREFKWAYQVKDTFKITGTLPRDEGTSVPTNSGIEIIFSHENYTNYEQYITFSPDIEGRFEQYRKTLVFIPDSLETETLYTVTVEAGLPLNNSQEALEEDYVFEFETVADDSSTDYISFEYDFFEYPETDIPLMTLYASRNAGQTNTVTVWSFSTFGEFGDAVSAMNSVPRWAFYARRNNLYSTDSLNEVASFEAEIKTEDYIEYIEFPESLPIGQYLVEITSNDKKDQTFLQITDLAASLVGSNTESGIWLHQLSSGNAVASAQIAFSHDEQFSAQTDTNGLAAFDTPSAVTSTDDGDLSQTYYYTAIAGENKILIPIDQHYERGFWYSFGYPQSDKGYWSYIYTNRTLYLPTDSLKFWGLAKDRTGTALTDARAELVSRNYYSSNSREVIIDKQDLEISDFGTYQGAFDYTNLNPGTYHLRIFDGETEITSTYVNIQTYTKPPYKIDVST